MDYARSLVQSLEDSSDDDDLWSAIKEMTDISRMLDADLSDEIALLEDWRASIPEKMTLMH